MKKAVGILLLVLFATGSVLPLYASTQKTIVLTIGSPVARVNGGSVTLDVAPFIKDSRTFVPLRFVSEQLGANVTYTTKPDGTTDSVIISMPIESIQTPQTGQVVIISHQGYYVSTGSYYVVGEVENQTGHDVQFVEVIGTFYDADGKVIATDSAYTEPANLTVKQKAPFEIIVLSSAGKIDHYSLSVTWE